MTATYTNPKTWTLKDPMLYADWNTYCRDNFEYLKQQADTRIYIVDVFASSDAVTTGDNKKLFWYPQVIAGYRLVDVDACVYTPPTSDTVTSDTLTINLRNTTVASADILTTPITIDPTEYTSYSAAAQPVITATTSDTEAALAQLLRIDVDQAGTGTMGLVLHLVYRAPTT